MDAGGGPAKHSNESESLRTSHHESVSDLVRKSDEPAALAEELTTAAAAAAGDGGDGDGALSQRIKTKSSPEELSTDLTVSGEASVASEQHHLQPASSGRLAAAVSSNRYARWFTFLQVLFENFQVVFVLRKHCRKFFCF